jgi:hypothetical protein
VVATRYIPVGLYYVETHREVMIVEPSIVALPRGTAMSEGVQPEKVQRTLEPAKSRRCELGSTRHKVIRAVLDDGGQLSIAGNGATVQDGRPPCAGEQYLEIARAIAKSYMYILIMFY